MEIDEAIQILKKYNQWRRDNDGIIDMPRPEIIGIAIDTIIEWCEKEIEKLKDY